jgi:hypothetical protein
LKISILTDPERPRANPQEVAKIIADARLEYATKGADIGIVIGGDGVFSYFGRIKSIPLLFVGAPSKKATGSKAYLSEANLHELDAALSKIRLGKYKVKKYKRLEVILNSKKRADIFTDVSLERGADSNCLRYKLVARGKDFGFTDFAIANGLVVSTSAGSTGYFSYLDKLKSGGQFKPNLSSRIRPDRIGICHIVPTYTERDNSSNHPLRYTIPWESEIKVQLTRNADARLYGITRSQRGIKVGTEEVVAIRPSPNTTQLVKLLN